MGDIIVTKKQLALITERQQLNESLLSFENILMAIGFVPVIGEIADIALICYYLYKGEKLYAALMLIALIPTVGDIFIKPIIKLFRDYVYKVSEHDKRLYHEEDIMTLMFRNHPELFYDYYFETWWHENERISGIDMMEHIKNNKSFYKILEELNNIHE